MPEKSHGYGLVLISICFAAAVVAVYWPVHNYDFVKYDDDLYVYNNSNIQTGITPQSIKWAFSSGYANFWHPLTWLSHILDWQIYGGTAGGHHITNLIFHITNTLLLFFVFKRMTNDIWPSAFVAMAFALHPLHVESVVWVSERKDVLSIFFWLLTMWAYARYVEKLKLRWYLAAMVLFVAGLMAKPMLVTLPFVFFLLDYWPLKRKISWYLLAEKIPFIVLSAVLSAVAFFTQQSGGAIEKLVNVGINIRIFNALISYVKYIGKMLWPSDLAVVYPLTNQIPVLYVLASFVFLLAVTILVLCLSQKHRYLVTGWFWYLGTLIPVIGIVQVGSHAMADRYSYITLTGLFIIIAFGVKELVAKQRYKLLIMPAAVVLIIWGAVAARQVRYWKNSITLFEHALAATKDNSVVLTNYIICLNEAGRFDDVIVQSEKMLKLKPDSVETLNNFGIALAQKGRFQEAVEKFGLAVKYKPDSSLSYFNLAVTFQNQNMYEQAASFYRQALKIQPNYTAASVNLAEALMELGEKDEAVRVYRDAIEYDPNNQYLKQLLEKKSKN